MPRTDYVACWEAHQIGPSMSRPGNPYDHARCESFLKTLTAEEVDGRAWTTLEEVEQTIAKFLDAYYHQQRLHSALGYRTPEEFEQQQPRRQ